LPLPSFLRTIGLHLCPLPAATKMAQLIFRDQNYVSSAIHLASLCMCIYTMSIHPVYLVSDLEGSDNDEPLNGMIIVVAVSSVTI
jgi:hypothetical protein